MRMHDKKNTKIKINKKPKKMHVNKTARHWDGFWSVALKASISERARNDRRSENQSKSASCWFQRQTELKWRQRSWLDTYSLWRWQTWRSSERWFVSLGRQRSSSSLSCCPSPPRGRSKGLRSGPLTPSHPVRCAGGLSGEVMVGISVTYFTLVFLAAFDSTPKCQCFICYISCLF